MEHIIIPRQLIVYNRLQSKYKKKISKSNLHQKFNIFFVCFLYISWLLLTNQKNREIHTPKKKRKQLQQAYFNIVEKTMNKSQFVKQNLSIKNTIVSVSHNTVSNKSLLENFMGNTLNVNPMWHRIMYILVVPSHQHYTHQQPLYLSPRLIA